MTLEVELRFRKDGSHNFDSEPEIAVLKSELQQMLSRAMDEEKAKM